ncbi:hypothetical protein F4813DRAFT_181836 [Daldinia decipiens]|uniref:uncharacterized protein n=1 Tax=Daldinia decipiens TaxID=326647 RepID=UPI0020C37C7D|nr:uncharacterized protein F4813DRAFT_181836 [Daldinia decipiens]KAI1655139.1 hypothetical protein F4813DRAFT_181836 [Daldinia decipiens]
MGDGSVACVIASSIALLGLEAGGYSYFAAFVRNELTPYFAEHGMQAQSNDSRLVFTYLLISAIFLWCSVLSMMLDLCRGTGRDSYGRERSGRACGSGLKVIIYCAFMLVLIVLACLTVQHTCEWWQYFEANNLHRFASVCHGLTGMILAVLILTMMALVTTTLLYACDSERLPR